MSETSGGKLNLYVFVLGGSSSCQVATFNGMKINVEISRDQADECYEEGSAVPPSTCRRTAPLVEHTSLRTRMEMSCK